MNLRVPSKRPSLYQLIRAFLKRHKRDEEALVEASGLDVLWAALRALGLVGAGIASAAVFSTATAPSVQHLSPGKSLENYVFENAPKYGVDPAASLGVSSMEGAGGGIGDLGTSFGPWQMHAGGALPLSEYHGPYSEATQEWAWSSEGVDYALRHQGEVCGGLKEYAAVSCIVSRFERPLHPAPEIAGAWRAYQHYHPGPPVPKPKPKKLTKAQKLRARHGGFHSWLDWSLGVGPWKGYGPRDPKVRPHVRKHVPKSWWKRRAEYVRHHEKKKS